MVFHCPGLGITSPISSILWFSHVLQLSKQWFLLKITFTYDGCHCSWLQWHPANINTLRSRQNGRRYPDDILKCIFLNENVWIRINISLKFVPMGQINNIPSLVQIMAWCRVGDKPLFEPMMVNLVMHICVTRPQWVKVIWKT